MRRLASLTYAVRMVASDPLILPTGVGPNHWGGGWGCARAVWLALTRRKALIVKVPRRHAYDDNEITPEFDRWLTTLSRRLDHLGLTRDEFTPDAIVEEFEAGHNPRLAATRLHDSRLDDETPTYQRPTRGEG